LIMKDCNYTGNFIRPPMILIARPQAGSLILEIYYIGHHLLIRRKKLLSFFYTGDQTGKYIGVVQGITANGDAGSQYFSFDVK